jgi:membrane-associated phospholipid phosphatase
MTKKTFSALSLLFFVIISFSQDQPGDSSLMQTTQTGVVNHYTIKAKVDIPVLVGGGAFTLFNFSRISKKTPSSQSFVEGLKKTDVNWFDRWGVRPYSEKKDNQSYIPFFVSMPLPLFVFGIDRKMRKDFFKLSFLYAEAMTITGVLYSAGAAYTNRLRPLVYSPETPIEKRISPESKKSFFAGHVALVATSTFFIARVFSEYHPESRIKWLYYTVAGAATFTTAYLRQAAGEHFLSDILLGTAVGTLSGLLTPSLHQHKLIKNQRLSVLPFGGHGAGLVAVYRL